MRILGRYILFASFSLAFLPAFAQEKKTPIKPTDTTQYKIWKFVEVSPQYPGGEKAMMQYLASKLQVVNMFNKPEGLVILQFIVTETGSITDITVLKSLEPSLDSAAIKAVKEMPNWSPGVVEGKIVKVRHTIPVRFGNSSPIQTKEKRKEKRKN